MPHCRLGGHRYYVGALSSLRHGFANMDVLVAGGTTIAYVYSVIASIIRMTCELKFETFLLPPSSALGR